MIATIDDFGNAIRICADISIEAMNSNFRFAIDGQWEGISENIISGNIDEYSLIVFGNIAS